MTEVDTVGYQTLHDLASAFSLTVSSTAPVHCCCSLSTADTSNSPWGLRTSFLSAALFPQTLAWATPSAASKLG